ncbi:MAG: fibronectin type III domain-containing protein [Bacteroidaceae bacterium]|nr:fibronectin type III domain-containing protein [Bacteroidaceae bacterium]
MNAKEADTWHLVNGNAVPVMNTTEKTLTASEQVEALGKEAWTLVDGKAVPLMHSTVQDSSDDYSSKLGETWKIEGSNIVPVTTMVDEPEYATTTKPTLPDFYHKNTGTIDKELLTQTRQSSVLLTWNTDGSPIDYFRVERRIQGEGDDAWKEIAANIDQLSYEDTSVSPLTTYEYRVVAVNDCEGIYTTETDAKVGECKHTGRVEGYVRFNDGTGAPDIEVAIIFGGQTVTSVITDESGYFVADELSYRDSTEVTYKVAPVVTGDKDIKFDRGDYSVTFDAHSNNVTLNEFTINNGRRFSGYVMYEGTSIPVKGVNFLVNGRKMHNVKGEFVESDYDGSFSFRLVDGNNTIQAVKDGHVFTGDGWYKNSGAQSIKSDVAGIYFYDATKVKLTGRVVGGDDQGSKPLLNNLSKNNLGDSLTVVLTLEGDNTSWLVYDNQNPNRTQREEVVRHPRGGDRHYTTVTTQRKRMTVYPDATTGEYMLMLPPVRWKVQQVYCKGYPTLFQEGQVSEVIDLTDCLTPVDTTYAGTYKDVDTITVSKPTASYHAVYNRIFHNPVEVTYKQLGYDTFDYFGDKSYMATELNGDMAEVPLAYPNPLDSTQTLYSFDYPVFSMERQYRIQLQVAERYIYNNDPVAGKTDLVTMGGGKARMQNGMKAFSEKSLFEPPVEIDSLGRALFTLKADQTTTLLTGLNALKTVSFTVERDGTFYEAAPLHGYVLNMFPVGDAKTVLSEGQPVLFDILRDPPGSYSTNTLAKGATLNYTYMMNLSISAGLYFSYKEGKKLQTVSASVVAPQGSGTAVGPIYMGDATEGDVDQLMYNGQGSKAFSYTMALNNAVSTSGDPTMVGADADVYIGTVQNVVVTPMSTIRAVTDSMYNAIIARTAPAGGMVSDVGKTIEYGTVVEIASGKRIGKNGTEEKYHLIRDVALGYGPKVQSQFIYSQKQILTQIIPDKAKEIVDLMYLGTKEDAQKIANSTQRPVYLSLREPTDSLFAVVNSKKIDGHAYNDTIDKPEKGINYLVVLPSGKTSEDFSDEVIEKYQTIKAWIQMIAQNEGEKMTVHDLVANYDVAGTAGVNYSETFASNFSTSWMNYFPIATQVDYFGAGSKALTYYTAGASLGVTLASSIALSLQEMKTWTTPTADGSNVNLNRGTKSEVYFSGELFQWTLIPVALFNTVGADSQAKSYTRTESFTIAPDPSSHLNVDVYRVKTPLNENGEFVGVTDVFTNFNYNTLTEDVQYYVQKALKEDKIQGPRGFVFRTRGGSTANPWEDERKTQFYDPGKVLDARTLKICNPKIRLDKQSVSGVSIDDAAHFMVFVSNESEKPEATEGLTVLQLFAADQLNANGAKISINGQPLTTSGMTITVVPGTETMLQMEVRAGQCFDFEKLAIGVMSPTDPTNALAVTTFDVHFLHEAGGVNIATPGDKWVLNTMAQMDGKRGWYLPVTINGFDRHQHNFDHIEFQYKESQRGDDSWTNLSSFYASDSLMAKANGVRKLIPENGNIVTEFYGDGWVMERSYDLRAVLFCRNGSDFLSTPSKVISGIKDTRRPQLFGTPEPKSGLLTAGDDIVFNFSEDIEYNNLSAITNFEVKGEVNNNSLSETVSVQFGGKASVETEAKRNFSGKDLTIDLVVKPAETGRDMPLFSHGTNGQKLQLWLTSDFKLKAVVDEQTYTSDAAIDKNTFVHVALAINQTDSVLTFFNGGKDIGRHTLTALYNSTGTLIFGRTNEQDRTQSQYYEGRMMEARLWYAALDGALVGGTYGGQRLTGYEKDLVDYYPMNEGSGDYVTDYTQGANARLMGASWAIPRGVSLRVDKADKGIRLDQNALNRTADHDYTLMFWFRTDADGRGALLSNGRGLREDNGAGSQFHIGFEGDKLVYRSNGFAAEVPGNWSDGGWHHFAMSVNRGRNVAGIYVDKELRTTFEVDSLGGISGGHPLIGATRYDLVKDNGDVEVIDGSDALAGNIDELIFFAQALPEQLITTYASKSPNGDEAGLLTYLSFDRTERQKDNDLVLVPYAYSKKLYIDDKGQPRYQLDPLTKEPTDTLVRDYFFVDDEQVVLQHLDIENAAPVVPFEEVKNMKFSFIGKGNQVLVELDEPAARLNHRNIYVTMRDIEDRNGNTMASPQTACYLVTNSSLQWVVNRLDYTMKYGAGESVELPFYNNSATTHSYTIENCPRWLTLSKSSDMIAPQSLDYVNATASKDLNIGTYNEIIYLTDENGITEPFHLNLTVEGEQPDWAKTISGDMLENSMSISGQVYLYDELDTDTRDIVGAFDSENNCHGFANISHDPQSGETALYLTVYDNIANGRELSFRLWQYSTGRELVIKPTPAITFAKDAMLGADTPVRFKGGEAFMQNFALSKGWNWVSFNVCSSQLDDVNALLGSKRWNEGDILTDLSSDTTLVYKDNQWLATGSTLNMVISPKKSYAIKVQDDSTFPVGGTVIKADSTRTITVATGWNAIGYTPMTNLSVETALSDYYDHAETGDVVKSHTEFAYFTKTGNAGRWRGSLQYMKPGEGYMLLRKGLDEVSFTYPYFDINSSFREDWTSTTRRSAPKVQRSEVATWRNTMSVSAIAEGFALEEGDRLVAYTDGNAVGSAVVREGCDEYAAGQPILYLTIGGERPASVRFAIERNGDIVAVSPGAITFHANAIVGTPDEPYAIGLDGNLTDISLIADDQLPGTWYTLDGIKLPRRPDKRQKGVYIFNGKKVVIK